MGWFKSKDPEKQTKIAVNPDLLQRMNDLEIERDTLVAETIINGRQMRQQMVREILSSKSSRPNK